MKVMAVIPARGGSKGVPGKNFRLLMGKPVIAYTIEAALGARRVDRVAVTTDHLAARRVCEEYGVTMVERPASLAGDTARVDDAMRHCCEELEARDGYRPEVVVLLYANIPVRAEDIIDRAVEHLLATGADSVQTVAPVGKYHPYWLYQLEGDKARKYIDNQVYKRQDLPALYALDSAVGVVRYESLMAAAGKSDPHAFWGRDRRALVQDAHETVDIDEPRDFFMAEAVLREKEAGTGLLAANSKTPEEICKV